MIYKTRTQKNTRETMIYKTRTQKNTRETMIYKTPHIKTLERQ